MGRELHVSLFARKNNTFFYIDFIDNIDYLRLSIVLGQLLYRIFSNIFAW